MYLNRTHDIRPEFSGATESGWIVLCSHFWLRNVYVATCFWCSSKSLLMNHSKPFAASFLKLDSGYLSWNKPAQELVIWLINWLHLLLGINNNNQERQWYLIVTIQNATEIPLKQFQIKDTTTSTSEHWFTSKWRRDRIHICSIVCLTNDHFDYLYLLGRLCWLNV